MMEIRPFQAKDQHAAKRLILAGLVEHWGWLDESKNPDLDDIAASYRDGLFLVGLAEGRLVATGALKPAPENSVEIVRMSVATDCRRRGYGRDLLNALIRAAKEQGAAQVVCETTSTWTETIRFYEQYGFQRSHEKEGETFFVLKVA
jgi:ribosomal protein S18 acetylase RimI-like enzyme